MSDSYSLAADWSFPIPIRYGPGRIAELPDLLSAAGARRPLVVTDRGSADLEFTARIMSLLRDGGHDPGLFAGISPNPVGGDVAEGKKAYAAGEHDSIVALGGGSGMDGGKAISLVATNENDLWEFEEHAPPPPAVSFPKVLCVPTTAGTGAETDSTSMVTHADRKMKFCVLHPAHKPAAAILDPELTLTLPKSLTAWTGCDAIVHAIEAYSVPGSPPQPLCDGLALEALRLLGRALPAVVDNPGDVELRGRMLVGSCLAGVSFIKGLGLVHAISHMVGALFDTQHGLTNAVILPAVLRFNADAIKEKVPEMAQAIGSASERFDGFHAHICAMLDGLDIPTGLAELGVDAGAAGEIADKALQDPAASANPRRASRQEMEELVRESISGAR